MERFEFPEDDQPSVLTGDLCEHFGGCAECPGFTTPASCSFQTTKIQVKRCSVRIGVTAPVTQIEK
jgi:hypothetical protein